MTADPLLSVPTLEQISPLMRVLGHPLRLRIIDFLDRQSEPQRVTEIIEATQGAPQAIVSQQLKILRENGLVTTRRQGNCIYYQIDNPVISEFLTSIRSYIALHGDS